MPATLPVSDLRKHFPKVRKLVQTEGEVLLSENGRIRYRLILHNVAPVDYWARLTAYQPAALTSAQARALHGDR